MRIEKIAGAASNMGGRAHKAAAGEHNGAGEARPTPGEGGAGNRAVIVPDNTGATPRQGSRTRHSSPFLAQLLANRIGLPQTRARRRALPADGSAHYCAAGKLSGARRIGVTDRRSI